MIYFHSDAIGTKSGLLYTDDGLKCSWEEFAGVDTNAWMLGVPNFIPVHKRVEAASALLGMGEFPPLIDEKYVRMARSLIPSVDSGKSPFLGMMIPKERFNEMMIRAAARSREVVEKFEASPYCKPYLDGEEFLCCFCPACVDEGRVRDLIAGEIDMSALSSLRSFLPPLTGSNIMSNVVYDRSRTSTGRMTVVYGPKILTLPKKFHCVIKSRYKDGVIVRLDIVSCEPKIVKLITSGVAARDIYSDIQETCGIKNVDRSAIKTTVISTLYGGSASKELTDVLGPRRAVRLRSSICEYFSYDRFVEMLRDSFSSEKCLRNIFGRQIHDVDEGVSDGILVSKFVQSTAVDVSVLGFKKMVIDMRSVGGIVTPLFLIHDALIVDTISDSVDVVNAIGSAGIDVGFGTLHTSVEEIH